jgi:ankyrin repeat protein
MSKNKNHFVTKYSQELLNTIDNRYKLPSAGKLQKLLDANANPNAIYNKGDSVLKAAILNIHCIFSNDIKVLLDANANPNVKDINGDTPLHIAINYGGDTQRKEAIFKLLLDANADPTIPGYGGLTFNGLLAIRAENAAKNLASQVRLESKISESLATKVKEGTIQEYFNPNSREEVEAALKRGHNINSSFEGFTLLDRALLSNNQSLVAFLVNEGADLQTLLEKKYEGYNLLELAKSDPSCKEATKIVEDHYLSNPVSELTGEVTEYTPSDA